VKDGVEGLTPHWGRGVFFCVPYFEALSLPVRVLFVLLKIEDVFFQASIVLRPPSSFSRYPTINMREGD